MPGNDRYPKSAQNPPFEPGARPDEQPPATTRVPGPEPAVEDMTTDERMARDPGRPEINR